MGSEMCIRDSWDGDLKGPAARTLERLREEGDEIETRQAWLEQLAEQAQCRVCQGDLKAVENAGITQLKCKSNKGHIEWP